MNILLYYEVSVFTDGFSGFPSIEGIKYHLDKYCGSALLKNKDVDIKMIIPEICSFYNSKNHVLDKFNPITIYDNELLKCYDNKYTFGKIWQKVFLDNLTDTERENCAKLFKSKLGDWVPDLIITFPTNNRSLDKAFPNALQVNNENGIFSRYPFMRTLRFEPLGYVSNFTNKFVDKIKNYTITDEENAKVDNFRTQIIELIEKYNPYKKQIAKLKKKFKYLVLLPIITDNFSEEANCDDSFLYLDSVLQKIPEHIGVIITKHDGIQDMLNDRVLDYLQSKYKNLITIDRNILVDNKRKPTSMSLPFFNHVDAVINCYSSTGLQACLWNTRIIANDKLYSHWFADKIGLDNIDDFLRTPVKNKNAMLHWYLTHFVVYEDKFNDNEWYYNYFKTKIEKYRKEGITFDFFDKTRDFNEISEYIISYVKDYYLRVHKTFFQKALIRLCSYRKDETQTRFYILGLKFRWPNNKKEKE